eukprot:250757-Chlamydomonas_euryale.AAC.24
MDLAHAPGADVRHRAAAAAAGACRCLSRPAAGAASRTGRGHRAGGSAVQQRAARRSWGTRAGPS